MGGPKDAIGERSETISQEIWLVCRIWDAIFRWGRIEHVNMRSQDFTLRCLFGSLLQTDAAVTPHHGLPPLRATEPRNLSCLKSLWQPQLLGLHTLQG